MQELGSKHLTVLRSTDGGFLDRSVESKRSTKENRRESTGQRSRSWVSADPQEDAARQGLSLESRGKSLRWKRGWRSPAEAHWIMSTGWLR